MSKPDGLLGHPADIESGTPLNVDEPVSVGVPFDPKIHAPPPSIQECIMNSVPATNPIQRFIAIDIHKHYGAP